MDLEYLKQEFESNMKEYDRVEIIVEKEKYTKYNVHKGMDGFVILEILMGNG